LKEKEQIEKCTAEIFLKLYNEKYSETFSIQSISDAPDVKCKNSEGIELNLEITLTEDKKNDIAALLGRANDRSIESLRQHIEKVKNKEASVWDRVSCLSEEPLENLLKKIENKLLKDYGPDAALVIRDTSGTEWDWKDMTPKINSEIRNILSQQNLNTPYNKGIWLVSSDGRELFQLFK